MPGDSNNSKNVLPGFVSRDNALDVGVTHLPSNAPGKKGAYGKSVDRGDSTSEDRGITVRVNGINPARTSNAIAQKIKANRDQKQNNADYRGGTTLTALYNDGDQLTVSWAGDSPAYLIREYENGKKTIELLNPPHQVDINDICRYLTINKGMSLSDAINNLARGILCNGRRGSGTLSKRDVKAIIEGRHSQPADLRLITNLHGNTVSSINMAASLGDSGNYSTLLRRDTLQHRTVDLSGGPHGRVTNATVINASDGIEVLEDIAWLPRTHGETGLPKKLEEALGSSNQDTCDAISRAAHQQWGAYDRTPDDITVMVYDVRKDGAGTASRYSAVLDGHGGSSSSQYGWSIIQKTLDEEAAADQSATIDSGTPEVSRVPLEYLAAGKGDNAKNLKKFLQTQGDNVKMTDLLHFFYDDQDRWFGKKGGFRHDSFKTKLAGILFGHEAYAHKDEASRKQFIIDSLRKMIPVTRSLDIGGREPVSAKKIDVEDIATVREFLKKARDFQKCKNVTMLMDCSNKPASGPSSTPTLGT